MMDLSGGAEYRATLKENFTGAEPENRTEVSVKADAHALHIKFDLEDDDVISYGEAYNDKLYEGDVAEVMITVGTRNKYIELEVNPIGVGYSAIVDVNDNGAIVRQIWDFDFDYEAHDKIGGWVTEWSIPFAELEKYGFSRRDARINVYRQDRRRDGALRLQALRPTGTRSFHCPESFEELVL